MEGNDHLALLLKLGSAIDDALSTWEAYLEILKEQTAYEAIVSEGDKSTATKVKALQHILDTLPARQTALVKSHNDPNIILLELPEICANLLDELQRLEIEVELDGCFNTILTSQRLFKKVADLEKDLRNEEDCHAQDLRRLKANHILLTGIGQDGELEQEHVVALVEAMEAVGVPLFGCGIPEEIEDETYQVIETPSAVTGP